MRNNLDREIQSWTSGRKTKSTERTAALSQMLIDEYGLSTTAHDPYPLFIMNFIGEVITQRAIDAHSGLTPDDRVTPIEFAQSMGKASITWEDYLDQLTQTGLNVDSLKVKASAFELRVENWKNEAESKANALFNLLIDAPFPGVSDEQIGQYLDSNSIYNFVAIVLENANAVRARVSAQARLANDPKQADKASVRECWVLWQKEPTRYKSKAAFGRDMLDKFRYLESQRVIERWCKEWESEPS